MNYNMRKKKKDESIKQVAIEWTKDEGLDQQY